MIISKELVCEVLDIDERLCRLDRLIDNTLFFYTLNNTGEYQHYINIYELAHKYKEWAFEKGYAFKIEYLGVKDVNIQLINHDTETTSYSKDFYNIQDIEQIILPCQWILDTKRIEK